MELQNACLQRLHTDTQAANAGMRYGTHNACSLSLHVQPVYLCVLLQQNCAASCQMGQLQAITAGGGTNYKLLRSLSLSQPTTTAAFRVAQVEGQPGPGRPPSPARASALLPNVPLLAVLDVAQLLRSLSLSQSTTTAAFRIAQVEGRQVRRRGGAMHLQNSGQKGSCDPLLSNVCFAHNCDT